MQVNWMVIGRSDVLNLSILQKIRIYGRVIYYQVGMGVHFHVECTTVYDPATQPPTPPIPLEKNSRPSQIYGKMFMTLRPLILHPHPQTQLFLSCFKWGVDKYC